MLGEPEVVVERDNALRCYEVSVHSVDRKGLSHDVQLIFGDGGMVLVRHAHGGDLQKFEEITLNERAVTYVHNQ